MLQNLLIKYFKIDVGFIRLNQILSVCNVHVYSIKQIEIYEKLCSNYCIRVLRIKKKEYEVNAKRQPPTHLDKTCMKN